MHFAARQGVEPALQDGVALIGAARAERLDPRPQLVGHDPGKLLTLPHTKVNTTMTNRIPRSFC